MGSMTSALVVQSIFTEKAGSCGFMGSSFIVGVLPAHCMLLYVNHKRQQFRANSVDGGVAWFKAIKNRA